MVNKQEINKLDEDHQKESKNDQRNKYNKIKKKELIDKLNIMEDGLKKKESKLEELNKIILEMKKNEKHYKDQLIRMQADFENYKKREEKKKQEFMEYAKQDLICKLLSVIDNLERAASYTKNKEHMPETIEEGIKSILKEFRNILEKEGVKPVKAVGEKFDPYCHEAIMQVESDQYPEDTVMEEISKGYYLKSKVIRPSLVKVSKGKPEKNNKEGNEDIKSSKDNK